MKQYGYVVETKGDKVRVRVMRESSCGGNCVSCKGCPSEAVIAECVTEDNLSVGDRVSLTMPDKAFYKGVFWGYGQTAVLTVLGAVLGYKFFAAEGASVLGAAIGLAVGLIAARLVFSKNKYEIKADKADKDNIC